MADSALTEAQALAYARNQAQRDWITTFHNALEAPVFFNYWFADYETDVFSGAVTLDYDNATGGAESGITHTGGSGTQILIPSDGVYDIHVQATLEIQDGYDPVFTVKKNGSTTIGTSHFLLTSSAGGKGPGGSITIRRIVNLSAGDYLTVIVDEANDNYWDNHAIEVTVVRLGQQYS